jgi:FixJ family two-component response regulator
VLGRIHGVPPACKVCTAVQGERLREQRARELAISARTVETHRANIMRKLHARSVAVMTQIAIREGLLEG